MTRTTEVTVERTEFWVAVRAKRPAPAWCADCGGCVPMLPAEEAARAAGTSTREIYRRVEAAEVHFMETPEGSLLVCLDSLAGRRRVGVQPPPSGLGEK